MTPSLKRRRNDPGRMGGAALAVVVLLALGSGAEAQSFPGVIDPVPAPSGPTVQPLPPPQQPPVILGPATSGRTGRPQGAPVPSFQDKARDCLHESNAAGLSATRPPGEDRDTFVRRCIDGG